MACPIIDVTAAISKLANVAVMGQTCAFAILNAHHGMHAVWMPRKQRLKIFIEIMLP